MNEDKINRLDSLSLKGSASQDAIMNERGLILIGMLFIMMLMAVTAMALNQRAGLQARMAANQARSIAISLGQTAAMEQAIWQLTKNPGWRTNDSGESYPYNGTTYNRKVINSLQSGYEDVVSVSIMAPEATNTVRTSLRYFIDTPFLVRKPNQVSRDNWDNLYFTDSDNHSIWKIDNFTGVITRVAGKGTSGFSGDGGPAQAAQLDAPRGVCVDPVGNVYVADTQNNRIRKIDFFGNISTVAGTGSPDYSGDGGLATSAQLNKPQGVSTDAMGNIYIADTDNHRIRKVTAATGLITTIAGTGSSGFSDGGGVATDAKFKKPQGVFVDASENIYIADTENNRIRKVTATGSLTTIAGISVQPDFAGEGTSAASAKFNKPQGIFVAASGDIYVADTNNNRIRRFVEGGNINTIAGSGSAGYSGDGGLATSAMIDLPGGVAVKSTGQVIISDTMNTCLRQVAGTIITTISVTGGPGLSQPNKISLDRSGNLYIADTNNHRIRKLDTLNRITTVAGTGAAGYDSDGIPATSAQLSSPQGVFVDASENIYIADTENHRIRKVTAATGLITTIAGNGELGDSGDGGQATSAKLNKPQGVFVNALGDDIFIADTNSHRIRRVTVTTGSIDRIAGTSGGYDGDGGPATSAKIKNPAGIFVDSAGNLFIADTENHLIRKVNPSGIITTVAGNGTQGYSGDGGQATAARLNKPSAVFVDSAGNIFIADTENNRIRLVRASDGKIATLAGTASAGFNGDNLPAAAAGLNKPAGVNMSVTRGGGHIYVSDTQNNRIRVLTYRKVKELY